MKNPRLLSQSRQNLDAVFRRIGPVSRFRRPVRGWIKAVREALGMSSAQLAKRAGVKQPTLTVIEQSEFRETVQLATLRRVAAAMNCTLVYALVPNEPLETIVRKQARKQAQRRLRPIEHSMRLEGQKVPGKRFKNRLAVLADDIDPRRLWDDA